VGRYGFGRETVVSQSPKASENRVASGGSVVVLCVLRQVAPANGVDGRMRPSNSAWRVGACLALVACACVRRSPSRVGRGLRPAAASLKATAPARRPGQGGLRDAWHGVDGGFAGETLTVSMERAGPRLVGRDHLGDHRRTSTSSRRNSPPRNAATGASSSDCRRARRHVAATSTVDVQSWAAKVIALTFDRRAVAHVDRRYRSALSKGLRRSHVLRTRLADRRSCRPLRAGASRMTTVIGIHSWNQRAP